jgi:hypothetical protein
MSAASLLKVRKFMDSLIKDVGTMLDHGHCETDISLLFAYASSKLPNESDATPDELCYLALHHIEEACIELTIETEYLSNTRSIFSDKNGNNYGSTRRWDGHEVLRKAGL